MAGTPRDDAAGRLDGDVLLDLARASLAGQLGLPVARGASAIIAAHPWLGRQGASFVTLTENGTLRGCIGTLEAYRPLGEDVAAHAVDAAMRDPRFRPVTAAEYPALDVEVSVLGTPEPMDVTTRAALEATLRPGRDGLILADAGGWHRATFLPQVWEELPDPHDFVSHLLAKAGLDPWTDWRHGEMRAARYGVTAFADHRGSERAGQTGQSGHASGGRADR